MWITRPTGRRRAGLGEGADAAALEPPCPEKRIKNVTGPNYQTHCNGAIRRGNPKRQSTPAFGYNHPCMADGADQLIIRGVLQPGVTWRARDGAGRRVVLKKVPDDCMRTGRLHPAIALRLTRLREAPM